MTTTISPPDAIADEENDIPLESTVDVVAEIMLPTSPSPAEADVTIELPFVTPVCAIAVQSKCAITIQNALVASKLGFVSIDTLMETIQQNVGDKVELDEFVEMVHVLPSIRTGEACRATEDILKRIYVLFQVAERIDLFQLAIAVLPLVEGSTKEKLEAAIEFSLLQDGLSTDGTITPTIITRGFVCILLSISALFEQKDPTTDSLQATTAIVDTCARETTRHLYKELSLDENDAISFDQIWTWVDQHGAKSAPWMRLLEQTHWPKCKRLTAPLGSPRAGGSNTATSPRTGETIPESQYSEVPDTNGSQGGLSFRFSGVDGGVLHIGDAEAIKLHKLLVRAGFTKLHPQTMYDTFVQHTGDGLLEEETFLEAIEELISMTNKQQLMQATDFLDAMLEMFKSFLPENCAKVDAFEIAAGFSLFTWGSKSDKLASAFHFFDADSKGFLNRQQLWRFLRSVLTTLLFLSPPDDVVIRRYGSLAELVDTGEQEIMENIADGIQEGDADTEEESKSSNKGGQRERTNSELRLGVYTFEDFGLWYNSGGFHGMSWLELLDLKKWTFVSPKFDVEGLDAQPVDPVLASTSYYTANNIQVDVDAEESNDLDDAKTHNYFTLNDTIYEEDEENESDELQHRASLSSTASSPRRRGRQSSIPSTLPAICLKNEVVLEFELPFDSEDDAIAELPLTTLSFDNGDLIEYFEMQRATKLNEVGLLRVYDAFEPFMESASSACIEKSTFDTCVKEFLPVEIARGIGAVFSTHSHTHARRPTTETEKDCKMVGDMLSRLFFAFNRGGTGKIDLIEFISAFTIFCAGSKSEKLAFAYRLFDSDQDGCLTRREMWKYLRSFLTILLALGNGSDLSAETIASVADAAAIEIADSIFKDMNKTFSVRQQPTNRPQSTRYSVDVPESADTIVATAGKRRGRYEHRGSLPDARSLSLSGAASTAFGQGAGRAFLKGGVVSFEEFARWYSTDGFNIIAWIELLDAKKWPEISDSIREAILKYNSRQEHAMANTTHRGMMRTPQTDSTIDSSSSSDNSHPRDSSLEAGLGGSELTRLDTENLRQMVAGMDSVSGIDQLDTAARTTSSPKDLSSVALQFKLTSYDNTTLRIRLKDVAIVYTISERMTFSSMTCEDLADALNHQAQGRSLTKTGFLRAMRKLVPRDELTNEDQEFLSFHLLRIYTLFEAESAIEEQEEDDDEENEEAQEPTSSEAKSVSSVEKLHLLTGLSVFCGTSKSAKLGILFKLYDNQGNGHVSRRHLFELLKSILVVLFAFSGYNASKSHTNDTSTNTWSINSAAERAAGAVISKLFCEARCKQPDSITLAEFAVWYAEGGYMDCPWLELLDLSKWPAKEAFEASKREKPLIYAFDMLEDGNVLNFTESDISTYLFMLRCTKLNELNVSKIYDALLAYATPSAEEEAFKMSIANNQTNKGGVNGYSYAAVEEDEGAYLVLTRTNFYECIRSLVPKEDMSEKAQQTSSKLLSRIFNVYDRKRCGRVNALELACGMSILGKGSKSQKLSLAFDFILKMRQQRHRTLNQYTSANAVFMGNGGNGINSVQTGGFGLMSMRGPVSTATGMRRSMLQNELQSLPHSVVFIYLRSFLLALMALSDSTYRLGLEKVYVEADDFIEEAMGDLMTDVSANGNGAPATGYGSARSRARVTFEQFGEWYNTGGYQLISWVELLDVAKWQQQQEFQEQAATLTGKVQTNRRMMPVISQRPGRSNYPATLTSTKPPVEPLQAEPSQRKPATRKKQIRQSEIVSTSYPQGIHTKERKKNKEDKALSKIDDRESMGAISLCSDGPIMVFAVAPEAAELHFFHDDIARLKLFLRQTQLHVIHGWELCTSMRDLLELDPNARTVTISRTKLMDAVRVACRNGPKSTSEQAPQSLSEEATELLHALLEVFIKVPNSTRDSFDQDQETAAEDDQSHEADDVDFGSAMCSLLVVCDGTLLDKLKCGAQLFQDQLAPHSIVVKMETLQLSLMCFLMAFYAMSCSLSRDVVRYSAQLGAEEVLAAFDASLSGVELTTSPMKKQKQPKPQLDLTKSISLKDFSDWFGEAGYRSHPWLELAELQHWPAAINVCGDSTNAPPHTA